MELPDNPAEYPAESLESEPSDIEKSEGQPFWGPYYEGALLPGDLYLGSPVFVNAHIATPHTVFLDKLLVA